MPFSLHFMPFSLHFMPIALYHTEKATLFRPELIELIEQERRYALFGKNMGWFWRLLDRFELSEPPHEEQGLGFA